MAWNEDSASHWDAYNTIFLSVSQSTKTLSPGRSQRCSSAIDTVNLLVQLLRSVHFLCVTVIYNLFFNSLDGDLSSHWSGLFQISLPVKCCLDPLPNPTFHPRYSIFLFHFLQGLSSVSFSCLLFP